MLAVPHLAAFEVSQDSTGPVTPCSFLCRLYYTKSFSFCQVF